MTANKLWRKSVRKWACIRSAARRMKFDVLECYFELDCGYCDQYAIKNDKGYIIDCGRCPLNDGITCKYTYLASTDNAPIFYKILGIIISHEEYGRELDWILLEEYSNQMLQKVLATKF